MVRNEKMEKIRRLLSATMVECDTSQLQGVRKSIARAVTEINMIEDGMKRRKKSNSQEGPKVKIADPLRAVSDIDRMIADEVEKLSVPERDVISG